MFERLTRSFRLVCDSWGVLRSNKRLMIFPILSGLATIFVVLSFVLPLFLARDELAQMTEMPWWGYVILFAFYVCNYFVIIFFNAALVSCALMKFNGQEPTIGDGLAAAGRRLPQIFAWALVSATVGMILNAIENAHEKAGQWISAILGTAWTALTYFVVPVIVVEQTGPIQGIKRSTSILKKTWGEAIVGHFGIGLFSFLLFIPIILLLMATGYVWTEMGESAGIVLAVITFAAFVLWAAFTSALSGIYLSALYQYAAHERVPEGFSQETLGDAFYGKKAG
jgi:hypothetical protein